MPDLISDGAEFSCNFCTSKLKLTVTSSSSTGDSKKLANQSNCFFPPPGGNCTFPPGSPPTPCPGIPPSCVSATGQTTVKIDGQTALGDGCTFTCPKGQTASLSAPGQTIAKHDEASGGSNAIIVGGVVLLGIALAILLLPEEVLVGAAVAVVRAAKYVPKLIKKGAGKLKEALEKKVDPLKGTKYSKKVLRQMQPNLKTGKPDYHGFPKEVDNHAKFGRQETIVGRDGVKRTKVSVKGSYQGKEGDFEWIVEPDKTVNHRLFNPKD